MLGDKFTSMEYERKMSTTYNTWNTLICEMDDTWIMKFSPLE